MWDTFVNLFSTAGFPPRWQCGTWTAEHGWLHILSDLGIWSAYFTIPGLLAYFAYRRRDVPFRSIFWLFCVFILACGTTHLMDALMFWWPAYRLAAVVKLVTAIASWGTVLALVPILPRALGLRSSRQLEAEVEKRTLLLERANEALREGEERLRLAFAAGQMGTWDWNLETNEVIWSRELERLHGIAAGTFGGTFEAYQRDMHPEDLPRVLASIERAARGERDHQIEYRLVWPDGSIHWIEARGKLLRREDGKATHMIGVCMNIDDRKRTEAELRDAHRRKDEFLAMLAHELRNPLAPIRSGLDLLALAGEEAETVRLMQEQMVHLTRLVDDLLDVSRIMGGKVQLRRERVTWQTIVRRSLEAARPLLDAQRHRVEVVQPESPLWVDGDPIRLVQVLTNLLNNAAKYTEKGGAIALSVAADDGQAVVEVRDNGIGIDPALLPRIFDLFTQADRSLDRSQGGLGIGLTLVRTLVQMHGGSIEAASEGVGKGSAFTLRLPLAAAGPPLPESPPPPAAASRRRVLIVEDNVGTAKILGRLLAKTGRHTIELAHNGPAALEAVEQFRPDVVLLDIGLPQMDGYEVARRIRAEPRNAELLLVALTGYGQEDDLRRSREAGFDEHLLKPPSLELLQQLFAHPKLAAAV